MHPPGGCVILGSPQRPVRRFIEPSAGAARSGQGFEQIFRKERRVAAYVRLMERQEESERHEQSSEILHRR